MLAAHLLPSFSLPRALCRAGRSLRATAVVCLLLASCLTSCISRHRPRGAVATAPAAGVNTPAAVPAPAVTPLPAHRVGTVRVIGKAGRFVLIEVPSTGLGSLPYGQTLRCTAAADADAPTTATLRVARERRQPFVVADVVGGEPHVGDSVYATASAVSAATPAPVVLPTNTSGVLPIVLPDATPPAAHP